MEIVEHCRGYHQDQNHPWPTNLQDGLNKALQEMDADLWKNQPCDDENPQSLTCRRNIIKLNEKIILQNHLELDFRNWILNISKSHVACQRVKTQNMSDHPWFSTGPWLCDPYAYSWKISCNMCIWLHSMQIYIWCVLMCMYIYIYTHIHIIYYISYTCIYIIIYILYYRVQLAMLYYIISYQIAS